jgi:HlyD family secretion protein
MSTANHNPAPAANAVDLSQLAVKRDAAAAPRVRVRHRWMTRYIIPGAILVGFTGMFAWATRESFLPAHSVTITPVVVTRAETQQEGTPLFQAAGWIEPRPTAVDVTSLVAGVVEELFVVEGQLVEKGEPVAKLMDVDARLTLQQTEANLRLAEADVASAQATLTAAQTTLENPNELQAALADAESILADTTLTLGNLPHLIDAAKNRRTLADDALQRKRQAGDAIPGRVIREAEAELVAAESALAELESRGPTLHAQAEALERKRVALADQLRLMTEPKRAVGTAEAAYASAEARLKQAQLAVEAAQLALERMTIRAPMAGRVLTLDVRPGMRLAGMDPIAQHSGSVITMYNPAELQVRVDVRLEDVPQLIVGQPATIETAALGAPLTGSVSWVTTRADIQKNTLQAKVTIDHPPAVITPEMLAQVTFLAPAPTADVAPEERERLRLLVPRDLLITAAGGEASVWVADLEHKLARLQSVRTGKAGTDELIEVAEGLDPTVKLIVAGREALTPNSRIRVSGQDTSGGASPRGASAGTSSAAVASVPTQTN